jgi:hypothetical protein
VREKQLNVRLEAAEYRAVRYWAYASETSMSELARTALLEKVERLRLAKLEAEQQLTLTELT